MTRHPLGVRCPSYVVSAVSLAAVGLFVIAASAAQAEDPQTIVMASTFDEVEFTVAYYESIIEGEQRAESPVAILIHGGNDDRLIWEKKPTNTKTRQPLAPLLNELGYAVVAIDMRGHGDSKAAAQRGRPNYQAMVGDLEAVKSFLLEQHQARQLNVSKIGIVAADEFAPVAAAFAEYDWKKPDYDDAIVASERTPRGRDVQAIALLSPESVAGPLRLTPTLKYLTDPRVDVAVLLLAGADDPRDKRTTRNLSRVILADQAPDDRRFAQFYETKFHGTELIGQQLRTEVHLLNFLELYVKGGGSEWRDRVSRLSR